ncbi:amino acid transporter [Rothia sp. AR01]|uniref:Amino acid transporter n=1 Tax=Rothia santali TaxID=2949643 RepID=A0A9X2HG97_9MICC|nr:amino acid transporter [Rothia santali]MCP3427152.1 amino acid transporter [Rothia santali]
MGTTLSGETRSSGTQNPGPPASRTQRFRSWFLSEESSVHGDLQGPHGRRPADREGHPWWKVMCLSGVDYFSTLGYQPAIAALAAGLLSPFATLVLVVVTLGAALPIYLRVARESPRGAGSIRMLERMLSSWSAKLFVLVLLGFTVTDFMITMTLSTADAAAHIEANPFAPAWLHDHRVLITLALLALLAAVFLRGFRETINLAVWLVGVFLALNVVVIGAAALRIAAQPGLLSGWSSAALTSHGSPWFAIALVLLVFPKLALGLSGFETGVLVMPQIRGEGATPAARTRSRIRGAGKLLTAAAVTMSALLASSSLVTAVLIPQEQFRPGGQADGRALAYLAHELLGEAFGTAYDVSTSLILWFAGASAMAGLLNLVPRYLPRYGMAPEWARASRPLVLVFSAIAVVVTLIFDADVEAQGGAYATGVLVLMTSAGVAVTLSAKMAHQRGWFLFYGAVATTFVYVTVANMIERPDGLRIALVFIAGILAVSLLSRWARSYELRTTSVTLDAAAEELIRARPGRPLHLIAHKPDNCTLADYIEKRQREGRSHKMGAEKNILFVEVTIADPSEFRSELHVEGRTVGRYGVLYLSGATVPNDIAALALRIRDMTGQIPHLYLDWSRGSPLRNTLDFLLFGQGQIAPTAHEVLRRAEPDEKRRPVVHVS